MSLSVTPTPTLEVENLHIDALGGSMNIVTNISFSLTSGQIMGLVGESGSGKTTTALALLGYAKIGTKITQGSVRIDGLDILAQPWRTVRRLRGRLVSYVPQDPVSSLNPSMRIGAQILEALERFPKSGNRFSDKKRRSKTQKLERRNLDREQILASITKALADVALPTDREFLQRFPHQLSGGQQQRIGLAMAFINRPALVVLDEPTTGLDVTTQTHVLATVRTLCKQYKSAAVYVSHDLAVVNQLADRIMVMYHGSCVEQGDTHEIIHRPRHPYSRLLMSSIPDPHAKRPVNVKPVSPTLPLTPILSIAGLEAYYGQVPILKKLDMDIIEGKCTAIVGESGSGKTTFAKCLGGLHAQARGDITLHGCSLPFGSRQRSMTQRRAVQYIFQNPYSSLNPRRNVGQLLRQSIEAFAPTHDQPAYSIADLLKMVALPPHYENRYIQQLSGGERQRIAIARAIACHPEILICDEITSALDVSVQAAILQLLQELQQRLKTTILFITHNLAVVRAIADEVVVLWQGKIIEKGQTEKLLDSPETDYMRQLLANTPSLKTHQFLKAEEMPHAPS